MKRRLSNAECIGQATKKQYKHQLQGEKCLFVPARGTGQDVAVDTFHERGYVEAGGVSNGSMTYERGCDVVLRCDEQYAETEGALRD